MNVSSRPGEGWMAILPLAFLAGFVVVAAGGPAQFVSTATSWLEDFVDYFMRLLT